MNKGKSTKRRSSKRYVSEEDFQESKTYEMKYLKFKIKEKHFLPSARQNAYL